MLKFQWENGSLEYYIKEGDSSTGRFYMSIAPEAENKTVVFDVKGYTHNTYDPEPDGIRQYNPMKLYTSKELINYMRLHGKNFCRYTGMTLNYGNIKDRNNSYAKTGLFFTDIGADTSM